MIYHVVDVDNDHTTRHFTKHWARELARRVEVLHTHQLVSVTRFPVATYIFSDLERHTPLKREIEAKVYEQLQAYGPPMRVLNHPVKVLCRFELLQELYRRGINDFRIFRALEPSSDLHFPAFLRMENDHGGNRSPLINSWSEYEEAMARLAVAGKPLDQMVAVEWRDASDGNGLYHKYGAYRVGSRIVPRGVTYSYDWVIQAGDSSSKWRAEEKWDYVRSNPHEQELMQIFELANIEFGRIDYSMIDGRMQVWEINTNPGFSDKTPSTYSGTRQEFHLWCGNQLAQAFEAIDTPDCDDKMPAAKLWELGVMRKYLSIAPETISPIA